jgi:hypothetical protein
VANTDPHCEIVAVPVPVSLDDEEATDEDIESDLSGVLLIIRTRLASRAASRLTLPVTISWSDSDGEEIWRERLSRIHGEFKIEDEFIEPAKLGKAIVEAAHSEVPLFITFTDQLEGELRFRIQFGDYPRQ